jgi:hypothetical protein
VPSNFTHDGRHREGHEVRTGFDVEPDHGIDQTDAGYLDEVVARLATTIESTGDVVGQRQAPLDNPVTLALELRGVRRQRRQLPEHVRDVGILGIRPGRRTIGRSGTHFAEPARLVVRVMPKICPSPVGS